MTQRAEPPVSPDSSSRSEPERTSERSPNRRRLLIAASLAAVWILGLVLLAWTTANPVTLNRRQIQLSHFVVTATRESRGSTVLLVSKEWKHGRELGRISVANLDEADMPAGGEFLVPLTALPLEKGAPPVYIVTPTTLPNEAPLIYPATPEAQSALENLLRDPPK